MTQELQWSAPGRGDGGQRVLLSTVPGSFAKKGECYLIHMWKHSPGRGQGRVTDALSSSHVALRAEGRKAQPLWIKERRKLAGEQTLRLSKRG